MINTHRDLINRIAWVENNAVWQWRVDKLQSQISTLQHVLIEAGILVDSTGVHKNLIVVDGQPYSIRKENK